MNTLDVVGVIFDVDGTLADSVGLFYDIALEVLAEAGVPPAPRERVYELMRTGTSSPLEALLPVDYPDRAGTLKRIVEDRTENWLRRYHDHTEAIPGSLELLHQLHDTGYELGIATSSGRALPFLDRWGVRHLFRSIVGREDVVHHKPHPAPVLLCLDRLALPAAGVVYVGDSPIDIQAGKAAGARTIGVLTGTSPRDVLHQEDPDHILESVLGLPTLLSCSTGMR